MHAPRRILLIRPSALGDVCRTVPVLVSLRRAFPDAAIDWLVQDTFIDAVRHHPALNEAVPFPRTLLGRTSRRGNLSPTLRWMNARLLHRYDLVIDAQGLFRSGLFTRWTGAPRRIGYRNAAELGWLFYTHRVHADRSLHTVDRMLALARAAGADPVRDMRLYADPAELAWVDEQSRSWTGRRPEPTSPAPSSSIPAPSPFALLAPTSRWPGKQWPADRFTELARRLLGRGVPALVIVGTGDERGQISPLLEWARHEPRAIDLVGETTIARLMALTARASLVVANDSAALHMGVGFDRPLITLFGPTRVGRVGPYRRAHGVIQHTRPTDRFDHKNPAIGRAMMERITVEEVVEACLTRLHQPDSAIRRADR